MTGKGWVLAATAVALAAGAGCMNCRHKGYHEALCVPAPYPLPVRSQVYLFMMNGYDVLECGGMLGLRDRLTHAGYPKVYYAQRADRAWYTRELRRVARDEPGARLVLLGYGGAAEPIRLLAYEAARDGLPVDSVVFLDPVGATGDLAATLPFHSVVVRSHDWRGGRGLAAAETVTAAGAGHYSLPNHPATVQTVVQVLTAAAGRVPAPGPDLLPRLPLTDRPDPTPRGIDPATLVYPLDEWDFLKPGVPPVALPAPGHGHPGLYLPLAPSPAP